MWDAHIPPYRIQPGDHIHNTHAIHPHTLGIAAFCQVPCVGGFHHIWDTAFLSYYFTRVVCGRAYIMDHRPNL